MDLLEWCLHKTASKRPSFKGTQEDGVLQHKFFGGRAKCPDDESEGIDQAAFVEAGNTVVQISEKFKKYQQAATGVCLWLSTHIIAQFDKHFPWILIMHATYVSPVLKLLRFPGWFVDEYVGMILAIDFFVVLVFLGLVTIFAVLLLTTVRKDTEGRKHKKELQGVLTNMWTITALTTMCILSIWYLGTIGVRWGNILDSTSAGKVFRSKVASIFFESLETYDDYKTIRTHQLTFVFVILLLALVTVMSCAFLHVAIRIYKYCKGTNKSERSAVKKTVVYWLKCATGLSLFISFVLYWYLINMHPKLIAFKEDSTSFMAAAKHKAPAKPIQAHYTGFDMASAGLSDRTMHIVCRTLSQAENLTKLSFADNFIGCTGLSTFVSMATKAYSPTLHFLNFSNNTIGDEGARHLGKFISASKASAADPIHIRKCSKSLTCYVALQVLYEVDLRYNDITNAGLRAIYKVLQKNIHLQHLHIQGNMVTDVALVSDIQNELANNRNSTLQAAKAKKLKQSPRFRL